MLAGWQLPVMGLDAFAITAAGIPASGHAVATRTPQHSTAHVAETMDVLVAWGADLPAQIAADLAGSPCPTASSAPASVIAGVGGAGTGTQDQGVPDSFGSHDELLQLLEGAEAGLELLNGSSPAMRGLSGAAAGDDTAFAATQQVQVQGTQAWLGQAAVPFSMPLAAAAPAPVAAGRSFAGGPAVMLQAPALPVPAAAAAGQQQQLADSSLPAVLPHVQSVEKQQQQIWTVLTGMQREIREKLACLNREGC